MLEIYLLVQIDHFPVDASESGHVTTGWEYLVVRHSDNCNGKAEINEWLGRVVAHFPGDTWRLWVILFIYLFLYVEFYITQT